VEKYKNFGKGSIKRRKSVSFEKFGSISIPIPPAAIQQRLVDHIIGVQDLESRLESARSDLANELERTLDLVGLAKG
jgi:restriction endonuclease S subunit